MAYVLRVDGTDITAYAPREGIALASQASLEPTTSEFLVDDDTGTAVTLIKARKIVTWVEDATTPDTTLFRGRVDPKDFNRGTKFDADAHQKKVSCVDASKDLQGIIVDGWARPSESDYDRVIALRNAYLHGASSTSSYARNSTDLATTYVVNANTVTMPATTYRDTSPQGVLDDCCRAANKVAFVTNDEELFYAVDTYTGYAAGLSITDVTPDLVTSFPPIWDAGDAGSEDGQELLSGAKLKYGTSASVVEHRAGVATTYDKWEEVIYDDGAKGSSDATTRLSKILDARQQEDLRYQCSLELRDTQVDLIKMGQTVSFRAGAANVRTPVTLRVARLEWDTPVHGIYFAHLELSKPKKFHGFGNRGSTNIIAREEGGTDAPAPIEQVSGACVSQSAHVTLRMGDLDGDGVVTWDDLGSGMMGSNVSQNVPWTGCGCPIGGGGWQGWKDEEVWVPYVMPADDATYIGAEVTIDGSAASWIGPFHSGFHVRAMNAYPSAGTQWGDGTVIGHITVGEVQTFYVPRSLITWGGATLSIIVSPDWHCCRGCFYCNGVADFSAPYDDGRGDSGGSSSSGWTWSDLCPVRFTAGQAGKSGWVAGFGDVDGVNAVFTLASWLKSGVVEASINGLIQPTADFTLDTGAGTVTFDSPPPLGSVVLFLYDVSA